MAKGKHTHPRSQVKKLSTLILLTLFMLTLVIIVLLALGILYLPNTTDDSLITDRRKIYERWFYFHVISFCYSVWFWFGMCLIFHVLWLLLLELVSVWRKRRSSGLKFFHGSQELSSITIFWLVFVIISWIYNNISQYMFLDCEFSFWTFEIGNIF